MTTLGPPTARDLRRWFAQAERALDRGVDEARVWLATPTGRRVRALAARVLIAGAPLVLRHPFFKTPIGRLVELTGGAALLIKVAETVRDWEPVPARSVRPSGSGTT
jgi:hypothetical protein